MPYDQSKDLLFGRSTTANSGGRLGFEITPDDDTDLPYYVKAIWVQGEGTVCFLPVQNDDADTLTITVDDKTTLDQWQIRRVLATGTTATGLIGSAG